MVVVELTNTTTTTTTIINRGDKAEAPDLPKVQLTHNKLHNNKLVRFTEA